MERKSFPERIESARVVLKKHDLGLAATMFDYVDSDRERMRRFLPFPDYTKTVEDELNYIKSTHEKWEDGTLFDFGLFDRTSDTYMGNIGVHNLDWKNNCCELGYWILGKFEGKGFVSEAVSALEKVCFDLGFHRIEIRCSALNERSASIPKRLGYLLEGTLRENAIEHGRYRDTLIFAKIQSGKRPVL